jgi:hypothetical protein
MRTNAAVDINTDWQINGIVKPNHVNALTRSIKYDYVLTAQMLEDKTGNVDVFDLLNLGINQGTLVPGDTHILINTPVPDDVVLKFPGNQAGPSGHFNIHIYALGAFKADCTGTSPMISFFFHTHGTSGAVTLLGLGADVYVGSFALESALVLPIHYASFTYEMALGELPTLPEMGGTIRKAAWMSNATGAGGDDSGRLIIGDYSPSDNYSIGNFVIPGTVTDDGLSPDKPIDMSEIHEIKWMPGSIACHTRDSSESESLVLKGNVRPYSSSISCPFVYRGGGSSCQAIHIEGNFSGGVNGDFCVTGSVSGNVSVDLKDAVFTTTTNGGFSNATVTYNGTTYTGESGGWSSEGTVSGSMGSVGYTDATIKSISVSAPVTNGGIQSNNPEISGGFGSGSSARVTITFDYNGYEGTVSGEVTSGGFTITLPKIPSITCSFNSDGSFSYSKDASGKSGALAATISSGGTLGYVFYLPVLYLNTATMAEDRLYSIRIEYMYDASKDGELPLDRSIEYDAITVPARAGIWGNCDLDATSPIPSNDYTTADLSQYTGATCRVSVSTDGKRWEFGTPGGTLCFMPIGLGILDPADPNQLQTWNAGAWAYNASDGSLMAALTKTIDETLYTIKVFIVGSHNESLVTTSAPYFKLFAVKPSENTTPITKRSAESGEHRDIIPPRMFAKDDVTGIPNCDNYHVPQWVGEVYLMKRNGALYAWGP